MMYHARQRMRQRKISVRRIDRALSVGRIEACANRCKAYSTRDVCVVVDGHKVVTVY
jgi:hypothetical protein